MLKRSILILTTFIMLTGLSFGAANYTYSNQQTNSDNYLKGQVVYVPQGVTTQVVLSTALSSETLTSGADVTATFTKPFSYNGKVIAPAGSVLKGTAINVKKAGRANHDGEIMVKFTNIMTPQNHNIAISAVIQTNDNSGVLKGGTKKDAAIDYTKNTAIGAGGGAVLGTALGALSGGSVGMGAVYGTAIGAGLGLIKGTVDKGNPVEIPANSVIDIYFNQPITSAAPQGNY